MHNDTVPRRLYYLAYGSNLHPRRLQRRVPSGGAIANLVLPGYQMRFHKRGVDGSAKCNALFTGRGTDSLHGVIYGIDADERTLLDHAEGLAQGYHHRIERVEIGGVVRDVFFYVADSAFIDDSLSPYTWYKALVVSGARWHGLHPDYIDTIEDVPAIADLDQERARVHFELAAYSHV